MKRRKHLVLYLLALGALAAAVISLAQREGPLDSSMAAPEHSEARRQLGITDYRYSDKNGVLMIEAWAGDEYAGALEVTRKPDLVHFVHTDPRGGRFEAETTITAEKRNDAPVLFRLRDVSSGESAEATWKDAPSGQPWSAGKWDVRGNRSKEEAKSFLNEREVRASVFVASVYQDAMTNLEIPEVVDTGSTSRAIRLGRRLIRFRSEVESHHRRGREATSPAQAWTKTVAYWDPTSQTPKLAGPFPLSQS